MGRAGACAPTSLRRASGSTAAFRCSSQHIPWRAVLALAARNGLPVVEEPFALETLRGADEAFLTNTIIGVMPLTSIEGEPIGAGRPGPLTRRLAADYARLVERLFAHGEHAGATAQIFGTTPQI